MNVLWLDWLKMISHWCMGGYFLFHGINAYLHFWSIPEPKLEMKNFLSCFNSVPILWTTIKWSEIILGLLLILGLATGLALVVFGVLIFGIVTLQWYLNRNRTLAFSLSLGYLAFVFLHWEEVLDLLLP